MYRISNFDDNDKITEENPMSSNQDTAKRLLTHYMQMAIKGSNTRWDNDNVSEMGEIVDCIIGAAVEKVREGESKENIDKKPFPVRITNDEFVYRADIMFDENDPLSAIFEIRQMHDFNDTPTVWEKPEIRANWRNIKIDEIGLYTSAWQQAARIARERDQYTGKGIEK